LIKYGFDSPKTKIAICEMVGLAFQDKIKRLCKVHFKEPMQNINMLCQRLLDFSTTRFIKPKDLLFLIEANLKGDLQ